jgi:transcription elongation factor Elf1
MASWTLNCKSCGKSFDHSKISDTLVNYFLAEKPEFPSGGSEFECPHCNTKAIYQRHELTFQSD